MRDRTLWVSGAVVVALMWGAGATLHSPPSSASPSQAQPQPGKVPLGFSARSFEAEAKIEKRFLAVPNAAHCEKFLRRLTAEPHVAGTPGDRRVSQYIFDEFKRDGLNPEMVEYKVLLSYPKKIAVEVVEPDPVKLANPEPEIRGDKSTRVSDPLAQMPWNGYSPSADLTAPVVYANRGSAADYEQLEKLGVSVKGKIVLTRYFGGYRGGKSMEAEKRGAAGVIVYSDPADDGASKGPVYPRGPWGPLGHFQRGAVVYDFITPGDPLTPGWASTETARRIPESEAKILPKIPMVPLSAADAVQILSRLAKTDSPAAPRSWQGGLPLTYRVGGVGVRVHMALEMENRVTPIWDVVGKIRGTDEPEKLVILSNHHDAWVYGAVDPSSGTATMLETARALGALLKRGIRPRRTILLGNWDAEEYTLTGSTEWGEQYADDLRKNGVICLNVDSATSGQDFTVSMSPALLPAVVEAAQAVRDPASGQSVYGRWKQRRAEANIRSYAVESEAGKTSGAVSFGILGGGSDFMVFLQHNGVPSLDMIFDGPYGVYHSLYDDFDWMKRYGDPGFKYHAAMSRIWGLLALRFANADLLPLDYSVYAREVAAYLEGLKKIAPADFYESDIRPLIEKCDAWREAAAKTTESLEGRRDEQSDPPPSAASSSSEINAQLMGEERALLNDEGLPGRPWFRHLIYAPLPSYDAETLPGLRETLEAKDMGGAHEQAKRLGEALDRARELLRAR
ncbi:MAG TPA: M28 family metallopeptidase [Terriglobia bacterium]|nr:M28 family metallopeptidase [Terriglobia bacterium]